MFVGWEGKEKRKIEEKAFIAIQMKLAFAIKAKVVRIKAKVWLWARKTLRDNEAAIDFFLVWRVKAHCCCQKKKTFFKLNCKNLQCNFNKHRRYFKPRIINLLDFPRLHLPFTWLQILIKHCFAITKPAAIDHEKSNISKRSPPSKTRFFVWTRRFYELIHFSASYLPVIDYVPFLLIRLTYARQRIKIRINYKLGIKRTTHPTIWVIWKQLWYCCSTNKPRITFPQTGGVNVFAYFIELWIFVLQFPFLQNLQLPNNSFNRVHLHNRQPNVELTKHRMAFSLRNMQIL